MTQKSYIQKEKKYPVLSLRDVVVFPHMVIPLFVGRDKSIQALDAVMDHDQEVVLLSQKDPTLDNPTKKDLYSVGTLAKVLQLLRLPDGTVKVLLEGEQRVKVVNLTSNATFFETTIEPFEEEYGPPQEVKALVRTLTSQFDQYVKLQKKIPNDLSPNFLHQLPAYRSE